MAETRFDKDKEILSSLKALMPIYVALIIAIGGGISSMFLNKLYFENNHLIIFGLGVLLFSIFSFKLFKTIYNINQITSKFK